MRQGQGTPRTAILVILWLSVATLSIIGVAAAGIRGLHVAGSLGTSDLDLAGLSALDQRNIRYFAATRNLAPGTEPYREVELQVASSFAKFTTHPLATFLHLVPGCLLLILGPLQFSSRVRIRHPQVHRWTGRLLLASAVPVGLSGIFFGLVPPAVVPSAALVFSTFFLLAATRAFVLIRRRQIARHREWMIRMFALAVGISTVRIVGAILFVTTRAELERVADLSFWIGELVTLAAAEIWIRRTRGRDASPARSDLAATPSSA